MCVPEVCSHEIVCAKGSVAPVAAGEEGAADIHVQKRLLLFFCSF